MRAAILETLRMLPIATVLQRTVCEPFDSAATASRSVTAFTAISLTHFLAVLSSPSASTSSASRQDSEDAAIVYNPFRVGHHACVASGVFEAIATVVVGAVLHRWRLEARAHANDRRRPAGTVDRPLRRMSSSDARGTVRRRTTDGPVADPLPPSFWSCSTPPARESPMARSCSAKAIRPIVTSSARHDPHRQTIGRRRIVPVRSGPTTCSRDRCPYGSRTATATAVGKTRVLSVDSRSFMRIIVERDVTARASELH
jgi:hypothetical protein